MREVRRKLVVEVENPMPSEDVEKQHGNHIAIDNIVQRLHLIYGDDASLELGSDQSAEGSFFRARLTLPLTKQSGEKGALE